MGDWTDMTASHSDHPSDCGHHPEGVISVSAELNMLDSPLQTARFAILIHHDDAEREFA
jgi:hypothetical protein